MATAVPENWTVVIVSDDEELERLYRLPSDTTIEQISTKWCCDTGIDCDCIFMSIDEKTIFSEDFSLEMIGEALPRSKLVNLRIKLLNQRKLSPVSSVYLHQDGKSSLIKVRPTTVLRSVLPRTGRTFECNGEVLNLNKTVEQAGLTNDSVICGAEENVAVRLMTGQTVCISVPREALVSELIARMTPYVEDEFSLRYSGRPLFPDDLVRNLTDVIEACSTEISVTIGNVEVEYRIGSGAITFCQFIASLSKQCHFNIDALEILTYRCIGCGRKILKSEEDFQFLQAKCCRIESLKLRAERPVSFKDNTTQTRNSTKNIMVQCKNEVSDAETQVQIGMQDKDAQCGDETKDMGTQVWEHKRNKLIQCKVDKRDKASQADKASQPKLKVTSPVLIAGLDEVKGDELYLTTDLPKPVTAAKVKKAVERHWNWNPEKLLVYREIGTRETRKCVQICSANDVWLRGMERDFSDMEGSCFMGDQVSRVVGDDFEILLDDAPIPLLGRRRNIIFANLQQFPLSPVPLYVQNERGGGQDFTLTLPKSLFVDILRRVIADHLKVHWDELKLFRWNGTLHDGRRCFHVCDNNVFTSACSEDAEFGTVDGDVVRRKLLKKAERTVLGSNEEIKAFPERRTVVIVASARWRLS